jgi:hypothetical protein
VAGIGAATGVAHAERIPKPLSAKAERRLHAEEVRMLGASHAAEHAFLRREEKALYAKQQRHDRWLRSLSPAARKRAIRKDEAKERAARTAALVKARATAGPPSEVGAWTQAPKSIPVMGINAVTLVTGKVLYWAYPTNPNPLYNPDFDAIGQAPNLSMSAVWDPATGTSKVIQPPINPDTGDPTNIWCSGISVLADGRILATGGNLGYTPDWRGLNRVYIFDPWTEKWTEQGRMRHGRWYPGQVLLPDGRTLVMNGYDEIGQPDGRAAYNKDVEVFDPRTGLSTLLGQLGETGPDGSLKTPPVGGLYPHMFVMPSGRVLVAGPDRPDSWFFNNPGNDLGWTSIPHPAPAQDRLWGNAVLLPGDASGSSTVMQIGGSWLDSPSGPYAVKTTETFDERTFDGSAASAWKSGASMNVARSHANTVLLPDGSMVAVGGGRGTNATQSDQYLTQAGNPERQVELYDPQTRTWRLGPAQVETRAYHSTAVLLPDGRVVSAGDDYDGTDGRGTGLSSDTTEIYSPPYLFKGARPTILQAPTALRWGQTFQVGTRDSDVARAVLMAPTATTHADDTNQREIQLAVTKVANGYQMTTPASTNVAIPGYYMLFLLNSKGVPSKARIVTVGS